MSELGSKIKLKSGEVLEIKEPPYGAYFEFFVERKRAPDLPELLGLCTGKTSEFIRALPLSEGLSLQVACMGIMKHLQIMHGMLFNGDKQKADS